MMTLFFGSGRRKKVVNGGSGTFLKLSLLLLILNLVLCLSGEARAGKESIFEIKNLDSNHNFVIPKGGPGNFTVILTDTYCSESFTIWANETKKKIENDLMSISSLESGIAESSSFSVDMQMNSDPTGLPIPSGTFSFWDFEGHHRTFKIHEWNDNVSPGEKRTRNFKSCYYIKDLEQMHKSFANAAKASIYRQKNPAINKKQQKTHTMKKESSKGTATRNNPTFK